MSRVFCFSLIFILLNLFASLAAAGNTPLNDLGTSLYLGLYQGGLYPGGSNVMPSDHASAGLTKAASIQPLDTSGNPSPTGKIVLLSIGMSNTAQEFCCQSFYTPNSWTFLGQTFSDPTVNKTHLAIVNGAQHGVPAETWSTSEISSRISPWFIIQNRLTTLGYNKSQVQVIWMKHANLKPGNELSMGYETSESVNLMKQLANISRKAKQYYPNLKIIYVSSRTYGGYVLDNLQGEPISYEQGFSVKWLIEAQINQTRTGTVNPYTGDLNYSVAPWIAWGPYLWADDNNPRSDGLTWLPDDFDPSDGRHPSQSGETKVGNMLMSFFKNDQTAKSWFVAQPTTSVFDFSPSTSFSSVSVSVGKTAANTITITKLTGTSEPVFLSISGLPTNAAATLSPLSCTPNSNCTSKLTITTSTTTTPAGSYVITVNATSISGLSKTTSFVLTITSTAFDFALALNESSGTVSPGGSVTTTAIVTLTAGSSQSVSLSCGQFQPPGISCSFSPTTCNPPCNSTLNISTSSTIAPGTYGVSVLAMNGGKRRNAWYTLFVTNASATAANVRFSSKGASIINLNKLAFLFYYL